MALSLEDRLAVHELVSLHGHLMDSGEFGRMDEPAGWRIAYRKVIPRRTPLHP